MGICIAAGCSTASSGSCATWKRAAGGTDNGAPGLRHDHPDYYAAFVLDPDRNNIEVVHHGPAQRSAASVRVTF